MSIKEEIRDELRANQIPEEFMQDCADRILALFSVSNCDNCGKDKKLTHCQECYDYEEYKEN